MNKYQEALDRQKQNIKKLREKEFVEYAEDFATLQELVDKEIPTKVKIKEFDNGEDGVFCPKCNRGLSFHWKMEYCSCCGQKLDWSDENER